MPYSLYVLLVLNRLKTRINRLTRSELLGFAFTSIYLLGGGVLVVKEYLTGELNEILGLLLIPYVFIIRSKGIYAYRYGIWTLACLVVWLLAPTRSIQYITLAFALVWVLESFIGKLNYLPCFLIFVISPLFKYLTIVFGFPIRLQLSQWAGFVISKMGINTAVSGNIISLNGNEFAVDPACVGLQMVHTAFIIGLFILAYYERKTKKQLSLASTVVAMMAITLLTIGCNLIRICCLVIFRIMPESFLHDIAGIACLLVYVLLPMGFFIRLLYHRTPATATPMPTTVPANPNRHLRWRLGLNLAMLAGLATVGWYTQQKQEKVSQAYQPGTITGFTKTALPNGIHKFEKSTALVYIKPLRGFYSSEHSPLICWQGSGYTFTNINTNTIAGIEVYTGTLVKGKDILYTAWWFDNGRYKTTRQLNWRWKALIGEPPFSLVNVSTCTKAELELQLQTLLHEHMFANKPIQSTYSLSQ